MSRYGFKSLVVTCVVIAALACALAFVGPAGVKGPPGMRPLAVMSGSMEPNLHVGSVAFIRPYDAARARIGDVVTFRTPPLPGRAADGSLTTHRIVGMSSAGGDAVFTTKGDANRTVDQWNVRAADIVGSPVFSIPWLGYLGAFARSRLGFFVLIALPGVLLIGMELASIVGVVRRSRPRLGDTR